MKKLVNGVQVSLFALVVLSLILFGAIAFGTAAGYSGEVWPLWYTALFAKLGVLITLIVVTVLSLFREN